MALGDDVNSFLKDFKQKARTFDIIFYPRSKNTDALLQLGITAKQREEAIMKLTSENYYRWPIEDIDPKMPIYFEFGTTINGQEIYIKLNLGNFDDSPHCISFHIAEYKLEYPIR